MKLKYYLRGLGVGVVATAIICSIANGIGDESLTTQQIIQQAQDLGMVSQDDYNAVKNDLADAKKSITDLQNEQEKENETSNDEQNNPENEPDDNTIANTNETEASDSDNVTTQETYIEGSVSESTTVKFNITQGMSSQAVSELLAEKGIIPDAIDFNNYVVESGNVNDLQVGEYEVKSGESYDTIIGKLTGR